MTLAVCALLVAAIAPQLPGLRFDSSVERLTVQDGPAWQALRDAKETFGNDDVIVVAQIGEGPVVEPGRLARLRELSEAIFECEGVDQVWSLTETGHLRGEEGAIEVRDLVDELPQSPAESEALLAELTSSRLYRDHILSRDGRTAAIVVFLERSDDPLHRDRVVAGVRDAMAAYPGPERLVASGNPSVTVDIAAAMQRDQNAFGGLTLVAVCAILAWLFRSVRAVLLPVAAAALAIALVLGGMRATGRSISVLSTIVPSMILALSTAYAMHLLHRAARETGSAGERAARTLRRLFAPLALSAVTTMAGFGAVAANRIAAIREFGIVALAAVAAVAGAVLLVVPAGLALGRPLRARSGLRVQRALAWLGALTARRGTAILAFSAALGLLAAAGASRLAVDTVYVDFLRDDHPANRDRREILEHLAGPIPLLVVLDAKRAGGALEPDVLARTTAFQRDVEQLPRVHATFSLADLLSEMHRVANVGAPEAVAAGGVPGSRALAAQYLLLYENSRFTRDLERLVSFDRSRLAVWVRTELYGSREAGETVGAIRALFRNSLADLDPVVTGTLYLLFQSSDEIAAGQARSLALALLAIGVVVIALFRSLRLGLVAAAPNVLPIALLFGTMGWLGVPLDVGTCVVACLCLGVAADDTIHFLLHYRGALARTRDVDAAIGETLREVGPPILYTSVVLSIAFALLTFSEFRPIADLGWLTALTMVSCLVGDLLLLPVLVRRFGPRADSRLLEGRA